LYAHKMATMLQNPTRNFPKSQTQKRTNQQTRSRLINNSKEIRKRYLYFSFISIYK